MIDLHCHLLPGLDDGPATLEEALDLARGMVAAGTHTAIATPHIDDTWNVAPAEIAGRVAVVQSALDEAEISLQVLPGGEVTLARLTQLSRDDAWAVRLGGGPYLLLECPLTPAAGDFHLFVAKLHKREPHIVLAHPERSPLFQRDHERLRELVAGGVVTSVTAEAFTGRFGSAVRDFAFELLREDLVHTIASDAHDRRRRPPGMVAGLRAAAEEESWVLARADWYTRAMPEAIVEGRPLPPPPAAAIPAPRVRRRLWDG